MSLAVALLLAVVAYLVARFVLGPVVQAPPLVAHVFSFLIAGFVLVAIVSVGGGA